MQTFAIQIKNEQTQSRIYQPARPPQHRQINPYERAGRGAAVHHYPQSPNHATSDNRNPQRRRLPTRFSDTPGYLESAHGLHQMMKRYVDSALKDADIVLLLVDVSACWFSCSCILTLPIKNVHYPCIWGHISRFQGFMRRFPELA